MWDMLCSATGETEIGFQGFPSLEVPKLHKFESQTADTEVVPLHRTHRVIRIIAMSASGTSSNSLELLQLLQNFFCFFKFGGKYREMLQSLGHSIVSIFCAQNNLVCCLCDRSNLSESQLFVFWKWRSMNIDERQAASDPRH